MLNRSREILSQSHPQRPDSKFFLSTTPSDYFYLDLPSEKIYCHHIDSKFVNEPHNKFMISLIDVYFYLFMRAYTEVEINRNEKDVFAFTRDELQLETKTYKIHKGDKIIPFELDFRRCDFVLNLLR